MSVALRGNLRDFGIGEVFQLIGQQRKTGVLEIAGAQARVRLAFDAGAIVSAAPVGAHADAALGELLVRVGALTRERLAALEREREESLQSLPRLLLAHGDLQRAELDEVQDLLTRESLFDVLRWREGSFHFSAQPVEHEREPAHLLGAEQVLMDGMRMVDEWQSFADRVLSDELVFQRVRRFESRRDRFPEGPRRHLAERVYLLVDGRLSARRVIDLSRLGTFEATRCLAELRDAGLVEPLPQKPAARGGRPPVLPGTPLRQAAATALPLLLLLLLALARLPGPAPAPALPGVALSRDPLAAARATLAARRVEGALEAYRFATGSLPGELRELADGGWLPAGALTGPEGRPYYYRRRGDGYLLLPPAP
jgi:hypothetical protein